ncbi:MAG: polysaccharide biosynthesis protein, partial [Candidatus Bathyarchaeia archaeon]
MSKKIVEFKPQRLILIDIKESELYMLKHEINLDFIKIILCDIRDKDKLESIFKNEKPQIVFHSAAYKHVPMMEEFPDEAIKTNIFGTLNLVEIADKYKVDKFIFI